MSKTAVVALFAAVFAAVLGVILAPLWNDFWAEMKPEIGAPLVALIGLAILVGIAVFSLAVLHFFGVLGAGAEPVGTRERNDYDALRQRIASGNGIEREYARRLDIFLNAIDRFFGDEGLADRTLFPRAFGLRKPAPLWTAPAFDRCLLLALVYPVGVIGLIWAISNHVGPAEAALRLEPADNWRRALTLLGTGLWAFAIRRSELVKGLHSWVWLAAAMVMFVLCSSVSASAGVVAIIGGVWFAISNPGFRAVALVIATTLGVALADAVHLGIGIGIVCFLACVIAVDTIIPFLESNSEKRGWQGAFFSAFVPVMILVCFAAAALLSYLYTWQVVGPPLLFLGLLTLLNAPFDWLSLGLTRALMRRGLEREKWWPYLYAVVDALLASVVIAFLAMAMVTGVQLFDDLAVSGGGKSLLPPMGQFLDAIKADPGKPEYWWVYATLFSTMLPSLINLFIAGVSLARGVPGVSSWLLVKVREGEAVPAYDRLLVAIVLALQGVVGLAIAIVAQGFLFWVIIWQGMPRLGIGVLDLAHYVAH